jgi:hypothetical protein
MKRLRLVALTLLGVSLACAASKQAYANILIQIDKPSQTMTVSVNGALLYRWPVSTGDTGFSTPAGSYKPFRMEGMHYSQEWTTPACRTQFSSPREVTAFMAPITPVSARRYLTAAFASRSPTPPRSINSSQQKAWRTPRSS